MNVAVVGSSGYIAGYLLKRFASDAHIDKVLKIDQNANADVFLSLERPDQFDYSVLDDIDAVVFTAAISGPDKCAREFEFCWNINVKGTSYFIDKAIQRNCNVLFFSSDAVFGDIPGAMYNEQSETNARTPYGRMKKAVEDKFKANPRFKCIRLSYVASAHDRFISYCLNCVKNNEQADIFHPFYRNVVVISDVVEVVDWLINHWNEYSYFVLNVAGKELVSRVRMADEINRVFSDRLRYTISRPEGDFYMNRPAITQMESLYLYRYNIIKDVVFTVKIQKELKEIKL